MRHTRLLAGISGAMVLMAAMESSGQDAQDKALDVLASVDMASAYVFRGETLNDGCVFQPCLEVSAYSITLGAWANYDVYDYNGAIDGYAFSEVDLYALCGFRVKRLEVEAGYRKYLDKYVYVLPAEEDEAALSAYPRPDLAVDDGGEVSLCLKFPAVYTPSLAVYRGLDGCLEDVTCVTAELSHEYYNRDDWRMAIAGSVTYVDQPGDADGISHYLVTHTLNYRCVTATIAFIGRGDPDVLQPADRGGPLDIREYGSIGISRRF